MESERKNPGGGNASVSPNRLLWSVILVAVLVLNAAQVWLGVSWMKKRSAATRPPKLTENLPLYGPRQVRTATSLNTMTTYQAKPGEWQVPQFDPSILDNVPPLVAILPAKFELDTSGGRPGGSWSATRRDKAIGIGMQLRYIVQTAYQWRNFRRVVVVDPIPEGRYDFIASLTNGAFEGLQMELKNKFGLVAAREMHSTNAFALVVNHTNAPGLKPGEIVNGPINSPQGMIRMPYSTMENFANNFLETALATPVIDQTGLTGNFDIQFHMAPRRAPRLSSEQAEELKKAITDDLGLELIPTNATVEVLVIRKVS